MPIHFSSFSKLSTREKVEILHNLCDFRLDVEDVPELLKVWSNNSTLFNENGRLYLTSWSYVHILMKFKCYVS